MSSILSKAYLLQKALKTKGIVVIIDKNQMYNPETDTMFSKYSIKSISREYSEKKNKYYTKYTEIYSSFKPHEIVKHLSNMYKELVGDR